MVIAMLFSLATVAVAKSGDIPNTSTTEDDLIQLYADGLTGADRQTFLANISLADDVSVDVNDGYIVISYQVISAEPQTRAGGVREYTVSKSKELWRIYDNAKSKFTLSVTFSETNNGRRVAVKTYKTSKRDYSGYNKISYSNSSVTKTSPVDSGSAYAKWSFTASSTSISERCFIIVDSAPV